MMTRHKLTMNAVFECYSFLKFSYLYIMILMRKAAISQARNDEPA
jgi:hypothetical protein